MNTKRAALIFFLWSFFCFNSAHGINSDKYDGTLAVTVITFGEDLEDTASRARLIAANIYKDYKEVSAEYGSFRATDDKIYYVCRLRILIMVPKKAPESPAPGEKEKDNKDDRNRF